MAPAKLDDEWEERLGVVAEEHPRGDAVHRELVALAIAIGLDDPPSRKWVERRLEKYRARPDDERARYRRFEWPSAMETGLLPWDATRVALDVLAAHLSKYGTRPTIDYVRWHWRIWLAAPGADFEIRDAFVTAIFMRRDTEPAMRGEHRLDFASAFEPWKQRHPRDLQRGVSRSSVVVRGRNTMRGTVTRKGSKWYAVVDEYDGDGKRRRRWHSGFDGKRAAQEKLTELLGKQQRGDYAVPTKETLAEVSSEGWLDARKPMRSRPSTWHGYRTRTYRIRCETIGSAMYRCKGSPVIASGDSTPS